VYPTARIETHVEMPTGFDLLEGRQFAIRDVVLQGRRGDLDAIADPEGALSLAVDHLAPWTARVVGDLLAGLRRTVKRFCGVFKNPSVAHFLGIADHAMPVEEPKTRRRRTMSGCPDKRVRPRAG
jgi:hypothetical protein